MALRSSKLAEVERLRERAAEERRRERELHRAREQAIKDQAEARNAVVAALADGRDAAKEKKALAKAEARANDGWSELLEAAQRRIRAADATVETFIKSNYEAICAEKRKQDAEQLDRLGRAAEELQDAMRSVEAASSEWGPLQQAVGRAPDPHVLGFDR